MTESLDLAALREVAAAAGPGAMTFPRSTPTVFATFYATFTPEVVLELIDALSAATEQPADTP